MCWFDWLNNEKLYGKNTVCFRLLNTEKYNIDLTAHAFNNFISDRFGTFPKCYILHSKPLEDLCVCVNPFHSPAVFYEHDEHKNISIIREASSHCIDASAQDVAEDAKISLVEDSNESGWAGQYSWKTYKIKRWKVANSKSEILVL